MNKKWKVAIYIISAVVMVALVTVLCFQFVKINSLEKKLDDLKNERDDLNHRLENTSNLWEENNFLNYFE